MNLYILRRLQVIKHGWIDSGIIAREIRESGKPASRFKIYYDILMCFKEYYLFSNQYLRNRCGFMSSEEKKELASQLGSENRDREMLLSSWYKKYFENWKFLNKYAAMKYETTPRLQKERNKAYCARYNMGKKCWVQYGVTIIAEHVSTEAKVKIGDNVLLARECDLDITGSLTIGNSVCVLEGVKILTHAHDVLHMFKDNKLIPYSNRAYRTDLSIGNNVMICARSIIMPGVKTIGDNVMISAGSVVTKPIPSNSVVAGNPAKVVYTLEPGMVIDTGH